MPRRFTAQDLLDLEAVLSKPRLATYLRATSGDRHLAMQLYCWNAEISAALYFMVQFCEVAVRNGAVDALERTFGENWHLNRGFYRTLPRLHERYQPSDDIATCASRLPTAGKVVADLKFAFWQYLFVKGQDERMWNTQMAIAFPDRDPSLSVGQARAQMHGDIEKVRFLRNRIAHHEPIFSRRLDEDRDRIQKLVTWRRAGTGAWLASVQTVTNLLDRRPI
jgi:hypothetical protein